MNEEIPEINNQEPGVYEPEVIDQSLLQQVEGAEITAQTPAPVVTTVPEAQNPALDVAAQAYNPVVAVSPTQQPTPTPAKSHRGLKIFLIVIVSLLVLLAVAFAVFYFVIRTPNSEYDATVKNLQTMKTSADAIHGKKVNSTMSADLRKTVSSNIKKDATAYVDALAKVEDGPVLKRDMQVKLTYVENKSVIEPYGQSSLDVLETMGTYEKVHSTCADALNSSLESTTASLTKSSLDSTYSACKKATAEHPTVPSKTFNDKVYVKYVAAVNQIMKGMYEYAAATAPGSSLDKSKGINDINQGISNYTDVEDSESQSSIANTAQPSDKIADVIKTVRQRKDVFFRW